MIGFIVWLILFAIGFLIGIFSFSNIMLSLFYGFPRTVYLASKGVLKKRACFVYLVAPIAWTAVLMAVYISLRMFASTFLSRVFGFVAIQLGFGLGIVLHVVRLFATSTRKDMDSDFWTFMNRYKTRDDTISSVETKMLEIYSGSTNDSRADSLLFMKGINHMDRGEWLQASEEFSDAVRLEPADFVSWYNLGLAYINLGKMDAALIALMEAVARRPHFTEALNTLGYLYNQLREWEKAREVLEKAVHINPNFTEAWFNLGVTILYSSYGTRYNLQIILERLKSLDPSSAKSFEEIQKQKKSENGIKP